MKPYLVILLMSTNVLAFDRCYIEAAPGGKTSCYIAAQSATYLCDGQDKQRTARCNTGTGEPVQCELRVTSLRGPPDIWCETPMPEPALIAEVTVFPAQPIRARHAPVIENAAARTENCDVLVNVDKGSLSYSRQYAEKVRCLNRRAIVEKQVPYENCGALITSDTSSLGYQSDRKRMQDCLDRQAGIAVAPSPSPVRIQPMNCVPNGYGGLRCN